MQFTELKVKKKRLTNDDLSSQFQPHLSSLHQHIEHYASFSLNYPVANNLIAVI